MSRDRLIPVCVSVSHPDEDGEERSGAARQVYVGVEQVFVQQRVVEGRQSGQNSCQLQVQLIRLKTDTVTKVSC